MNGVVHVGHPFFHLRDYCHKSGDLLSRIIALLLHRSDAFPELRDFGCEIHASRRERHSECFAGGAATTPSRRFTR